MAAKKPVTAKLKRLPVGFYKNSNGIKPVREWLLEQSEADRRIIGADIASVEFGWPIGMPVCRSLGQGLWEVRSSITNGIARVIFFVHQERMILLEGFVKKTQKTPIDLIKLALRRKREVERESK